MNVDGLTAGKESARQGSEVYEMEEQASGSVEVGKKQAGGEGGYE